MQVRLAKWPPAGIEPITGDRRVEIRANNLERPRMYSANKTTWIRPLAVLTLYGLALWCPTAYGHHVLGRPSYSLTEDSNTPSSLQQEVEVGEYLVNYMVFPAFPRPNEPGRVHLYIKRTANGEPFHGDVSFAIHEDGWFQGDEENLGVQPPDDNVFRQGFVFHDSGNYIISARFEADGETHRIDFPLRVGDPWPIGPFGVGVGMLCIVLVAGSVLRPRRLLTAKLRSARTDIGS